MGNCQCSSELSPSKDVEEPLPITQLSDEPTAETLSSVDQGEPAKDVQENGVEKDSEEPDVLDDEQGSTILEEGELLIDDRTFLRQVSITSACYPPYVSERAEIENLRAERMAKLASQPGFFVLLDYRYDKAFLKRIGIDAKNSAAGISSKLDDLHLRMVKSSKFDASQILGVFLSVAAAKTCNAHQRLLIKLAREKKIVPFMNLHNDVLPQENGVQLIDIYQSFEETLQSAVDDGLFGVRMRSVVKQPNAEGIVALVDQQFDVAKRILAKGLLPVLHIEVDIKASEKSNVSREDALELRLQSEEILFDALLDHLSDLRPDERVMFDLLLPARPNTYLSLVGHPNTVRVLGMSGSYNLKVASTTLAKNFGLVASFGNVLLEGISSVDKDGEFSSTLEASIKKVHRASVAVPTKEMQSSKVAHTLGFFACLDSTDKKIDEAMDRYHLGKRDDYANNAAVMDRLHEMRSRILTNTKFSGSRVLGVLMSQDTMERTIHSKSTAKYLWEEKQIVPFLTLDHGLRGEKDGVQLMKDVPKLDQVLSKAVAAGIYGVKARTLILKPNAAGIDAAIAQHISVARKMLAKELVPVLHVEVDRDAENKAECENLLIKSLGERLAMLRQEQKVIMWLAFPVTTNRYLPLLGLPNVIRVVGVSGGHDRALSCSLLQQNFGTIGGFNRAFVEGMHSDQTDEELTSMVDESCQAIFESSRNVPLKTIQAYKVSKQDGFFAALAHLASKTEFSIAAQVSYGGGAEGMQPVFERIITNPRFNSLHVIGVSLTSDHLAMQVNSIPIAKYIWEEKQFVPFLKIDTYGLAEEANGVQQFKELPQNELDWLLDEAKRTACFGTIALSKIRTPDSKGIHDLVNQQITLAKRVASKGLVHMPMLFIDKEDAPEKDKCERVLRHCLMKALKKLDEHEKIMLNFILPSVVGYYDCFVSHSSVLRVLGSAGSYTLEESCNLLAENAGMVGNFGTAILRNLSSGQSYAEFTKAIGQACANVSKSCKKFDSNKTRVSRLSVMADEETRASLMRASLSIGHDDSEGPMGDSLSEAPLSPLSPISTVGSRREASRMSVGSLLKD